MRRTDRRTTMARAWHLKSRPSGMPTHDNFELRDMELPPLGVEPQKFLGVLGVTGATAYFGLLDVASAKQGDVVFVSAAAGAVGSVVVQLAKAKGMIVVGSAGGAEKNAFVRSLGADRVIDY